MRKVFSLMAGVLALGYGTSMLIGVFGESIPFYIIGGAVVLAATTNILLNGKDLWNKADHCS